MSGLVEIENLKKYYPVSKGLFSSSRKFVHAVDGVTLNIGKGETLGLAGESGCGKTTLGMLCLRLLEPTAGTVRYDDRDLFELNKRQVKTFRREAQMIFQDPYGSLNPRKSISESLSVPIIVHKIVRRNKIDDKIQELLENVGLIPAGLYMKRFPHNLSGGQNQRVGIARALSTNPSFVVADEPVASLDVSVRGQILDLMKKVQEKTKLSFLDISHDLSVLRSVSDRVAIMYLGKIVELAEVDTLYKNPLHPYTKALLSAVPLPDPKRTRAKERIILKGETPSPIDIPEGCRFQSRCFNANSQCTKKEPGLVEVTQGHMVACLRV